MNMLPAPAPNSTSPFLPELSSCDSLRPLLPRRPWALGGSPSFPEAIAEMLGRISFTWRGDRQDVSQGMAHQQSHWRPLAPSHTSQVSITEPRAQRSTACFYLYQQPGSSLPCTCSLMVTLSPLARFLLSSHHDVCRQ